MDALTVLIVDDDADMRLYVRSCLRSLDARVGRVLDAADGLEALSLVRSGVVDVVVSDVVLPRLDGFALCREIKGDPATRDIPVLLISGQAEGPPPGVQADGFLAKPFNARELGMALGSPAFGLSAGPPERAG